MSAPPMRMAAFLPLAMLFTSVATPVFFAALSLAQAGLSVSRLSCHRDAPGALAGRCLGVNDGPAGRELQWVALEDLRAVKSSGGSPRFLVIQTADPKVELALGLYLGFRFTLLDRAEADLKDYLAHPARQDLDVDVSGLPGQLVAACVLWALEGLGAAAWLWWLRATWRQRRGGPAPAV